MFFNKRHKEVKEPTNRREALKQVASGTVGAIAAVGATSVLAPVSAHAATTAGESISNSVPLGAWSVFGKFLTRTGPGGINIPPDWGLCTFEISGTVTVGGSYITVGVGAWKPLSAGKFSFSLVQQVWKGPGVQYVEGWTGNVIIYIQEATLASNGLSWSANAVARQFDKYGTVICDDTLSLNATRIKVGNLDTLPIQKFDH